MDMVFIFNLVKHKNAKHCLDKNINIIFFKEKDRSIN